MKEFIGWICCILYVAWDILNYLPDNNNNDNPFPKP